jgi:hypothetical protein
MKALNAFALDCPALFSGRDLALFVVRKAREMFDENGEISPAAFVLLPSGAALVIPVHHVLDNRDLMHAMLEAVVAACGATAIVQAHEAWMAEPDPAAVFEDWSTPVSENPNRKEILFVHLETSSGESCMWMTPIEREGESAKLGEAQEIPGATTRRMTGYFESTRKAGEVEA